MKDLRIIELIIKELKNNCKYILKFQKYDGISIECYVAEQDNIDLGIKEVKNICKKLKLNPIDIECNKEKTNLFLLQFPELLPKYTDKELQLLYEDNYKRLISDLKSNDINNKVDLNLIIKNKNIFIKQAMISFYNINTNRYKGTLQGFLNNKELWDKAEVYFNDYIKCYL